MLLPQFEMSSLPSLETATAYEIAGGSKALPAMDVTVWPLVVLNTRITPSLHAVAIWFWPGKKIAVETSSG